MTILFMGGEMAAFTPSDSGVTEITSGAYNSSFARAAIHVPPSTSYLEGTPSASATDIWMHFDMQTGANSTPTAFTRMSWYDSSGNERIRLKYTDATSNLLDIQYWNGSAFTSAGTATVDLTDRQTIDINVVCNSASGSANVYVAGTNRITASIDTTSITNLKKFRFTGGGGGAGFSRMSQVAVADESTIGMRLMTFYPNGAGATSSWTGAYTDIDEAVYNDADFILSGTANQVSTFSQTGPTISGYTVRAIAVAARAKRGAAGPQNARMALRSAGTTYFSGSDIALDVAYTPIQTIWETDPATSAAWAATAVTSLQPGVKSIT